MLIFAQNLSYFLSLPLKLDNPYYHSDQCGKTFPTNGSMQTHVKIVHLKTGSVKCEICKQGVANVFYLRKHMREVHPDNNLQIQNR